ncbi:CYFA0S04e04500g1_1 [Cyberlindnera fabianii]|uniref:CYFA0S04e04500g1_1 n=1 Tax=Cyberlindnera fabianii TaxID=36022 RepID=A0A061AZG6_CYBFA|nr:CYFA0S04e04500g1_1 [Cyberlindnera fabianii]
MDWSKQKRSSFSVGSGYKPNNYVDYERFPQITSSPQHSPLAQAQLPVRSAYYETHWPISSVAWSTASVATGMHTLAVGTYKEDSMNKVEIVSGTASLVEHANGTTSEGLTFTKMCDANVALPITKLQWDPSGTSHKLLTTNDKLRLWEQDEFNQDPVLLKRATLANKSFDTQRSGGASFAPLTSFDWNKVNSNLVITSSIDTTCTVWDLQRPNYPKTQLIAHDSEVFDVQFIKGSTDIFASVGCDGSMRVFDLRSLEHSTIIYEPPSAGVTTASTSSASSSLSHNHGDSISLLRIAASNTDVNVIATFAAKSDKISIMDMRYPGMPVLVLTGHSGNVNSIQWHPTQPYLLSGADDCQALVWDVRRGVTANPGKHHTIDQLDHPDFAYADTMEVNNVAWSPSADWFSAVSGKGVQAVRMSG